MRSTALAARDRPRRIAGIGQPVGPPDRAAQRGPVTITLQTHNPKPPPVAGHVVVHARVAHRLALADRDRMARQQERVEVEADGIGALPVQRRGDELPRTGAVLATRAAHTAAAIVIPAVWSPMPPRWNGGDSPGRLSRCARPGPGPERGDVVGRAVGVGSAFAVSGDQAVHQPRDWRRPPSRSRSPSRRKAPGRTLVRNTSAAVIISSAVARPSSVVDIQHDAALAAVVHLERRAFPVLDAEHPAEHPRRIARRWLDLDDVGAPVGENPARGWTGHPHPEFDDLDALQRSGHGHPFQRFTNLR